MLELYSPHTSAKALWSTGSPTTLLKHKIRHSTHIVSLPSVYKQNLFSLAHGGTGARDWTEESGSSCTDEASTSETVPARSKALVQHGSLHRGSLLKRGQETSGSCALQLTWDFDVFSATEEQLD
jgi:hypothetical protein